MFGTQNLILFIGAVVTLSAIPGPDMMYIVSRSVSQGRSAGSISVLGVSTALFFHSLIVAFGLSALLATSQWAFDIVRYLGATYLLFLAIQAWRQAPPRADVLVRHAPASVPLMRLYRQGFVTGLLNPKTTMFFAALLPQFVQNNVHDSSLPFLFLGAVVVVAGGICDMSVALLSGALSETLRSNQKVHYWTKRITSIVFISLALNLLRIKNQQVAN